MDLEQAELFDALRGLLEMFGGEPRTLGVQTELFARGFET